MDKKEFIAIRKRLSRTQKELAELLGTSLKAISSYEQGWRNIPVHVERQVLFLLSRLHHQECPACWDILKCPESRRQACPAWQFHSGDLCWFINGTLCARSPVKSWEEKIAVCRKCPVLKKQLSL